MFLFGSAITAFLVTTLATAVIVYDDFSYSDSAIIKYGWFWLISLVHGVLAELLTVLGTMTHLQGVPGLDGENNVAFALFAAIGGSAFILAALIDGRQNQVTSKLLSPHASTIRRLVLGSLRPLGTPLIVYRNLLVATHSRILRKLAPESIALVSGLCAVELSVLRKRVYNYMSHVLGSEAMFDRVVADIKRFSDTTEDEKTTESLYFARLLINYGGFSAARQLLVESGIALPPSAP